MMRNNFKIPYIYAFFILFVLMIGGFCNKTHAQQDPLYSQYMFNTLPMNPAYAGSKGMMSMMILGRKQWLGFEGAPTTASFSIHSPIWANMAGGASLIYDTYGPVNLTSAYGDYAYHLKLNEKIKLSLGLKGGFNFYSIDYNKLDRTIQADEAYNGEVEQVLMPNFGFGLFMYSSRFYLGLSVPRIMENVYEEASETYGEGKEFRQYYGMMGVVLPLSEHFVLKPSVMTRLASGAPLSIDANINTIIQDKIWLGVMYRLNDSFGGLVQYQISQQLRVGYAFDLNTNALSSYHSGSHEIMLNFDFNFQKDKVFNPRYF